MVEVAVEETAVVTGMALLGVDVKNASSVTSLDTLRVNAKRIKIFAIVAMALGTLQRTANRLVGPSRAATTVTRLDTSRVVARRVAMILDVLRCKAATIVIRRDTLLATAPRPEERLATSAARLVT